MGGNLLWWIVVSRMVVRQKLYIGIFHLHLFGIIGDTMIRWLAFFIAVTLWFVPSFAKRAFGGFDYQQIIFFGVMPGAATGTDWAVYELMLKWLVIRPLFVIAFIYICYRMLKLLLGKRWRPLPFISWLAILSFGIFGTHQILASVGYYDYVQLSTKIDKTDQYFNHYSEEFKKPKIKKNLVMIYVESLENTFGEKEIFNNNLNAPLDDIFAKPAFEMHQLGGTNWTMAGLVASQCGVPLATFLGNAVGAYTDEMLGNLTCLGDILHEYGYFQSFLVGTDVKFSGMDKFYRSHEYDSVRGQFELADLYVDQKRTGWGAGLQDDTLIDIAFDEILSLNKLERPFNVTVVLTDNHATDGYLSPRCETQGFARQLHEVVHCTNATVKKLIKKLKQENILDNTVVVVMGDHLFMGEFPEELNGYTRNIYFNFLSTDATQTNPNIKKITHFDVYPTLLSLVTGIEYPVLHLGVNLLSPYTADKMNTHGYVFGSEYQPNAPFFKKFWNVK